MVGDSVCALVALELVALEVELSNFNSDSDVVVGLRVVFHISMFSVEGLTVEERLTVDLLSPSCIVFSKIESDGNSAKVVR